MNKHFINDFYTNDSERTDALITHYERHIAYLKLGYLTDKENDDLKRALLYLRGHKNMLTYKFNKDKKISKIILGPSSWMNVFPTLRDESCVHMRIFIKVLKKSFEGSDIDVELSTRCPSADPAAASGSGAPNVGTDVETNVETNVGTNGGYKSRRRNRKPARKTRRRGRGRDRRGKSHHKKYTH